MGTPVTTNEIQTTSAAGTTLSGIVHGGQSPISGAHVYLYALPNTAWAGPGIPPSSSNASISLLTSSVLNQTPAGGFDGTNYYATTDANGAWSISGDYTCPASHSGGYIYAAGGNPGLASGTNNKAATLVAGVTLCPSSSEYVIVNEVSTVAIAYALGGFITDPLHVSSSSSALAKTARQNATSTYESLFSMTTGLANTTTPGGNGTIPQAEIHTLANILAACVNTDGTVSGPTNPTPCYTLFNNATNGGSVPSDTATAAVNIAHNPGANVSNLFELQTANSPFQPSLSAPAPNDWTVAINFSGGGVAGSTSVAIDGLGNVWVGSPTIGAGCPGALSVFGPTGVPISGSSGYSGGGMGCPYGLAIDSANHAWVSSYIGVLSEFQSDGTALTSSSGITGGGMGNPWGIAFDASGNLWIANYGNSTLSEYNPTSGWVTTTGITGGGLDTPRAVAVDASGDVWVADYGTLGEYNPASGWVFASGDSAGGPYAYFDVAVDGSGNVWAMAGSAIGGVTSSGAALPGSPFTGGGAYQPAQIAVDGSGNIWVTDYYTSAISEFNSSGTAISGSSGYQGGPVSDPYGIAIDASGNVWVANNAAKNVTEFVGAATPVVTPKVANLMTSLGYGQHAVNRP